MSARVGLLCLALVAAALLVPPSGAILPSAGLIQPGAAAWSDSAGCTYNFIFDGAGGPYIGLAAHCVDRVGEAWYTDNGQLLGERFVGTVAFIGNADDTARDYAFVKIAASAVPFVRAGVKGHEQYPTGYTVASETRLGDRIQQSGYGTAFSLVAPTQEERQGVLTFDDARVWEFAGAMDFGDSGGPLVHIATGKALGIESRVCIGLCTDEGPTVQGILSDAATRGFPVSLRAA